MSRIALIWELGADFGHVSRMHILATELSRRGHTVTFALSRPADLRQVVAGVSPIYRVLQGPEWPDRPVRLSREPANLTEVLLALGYHKPAALLQKVKGWRELLDGLRPDLIIYDYAPTVLLATRDYGAHKVSLDDPFSKPPRIIPLPAFGTGISPANLALSEEKLVAAVNQALPSEGLEGITHAYDIFETHKSFLLSVPELDPFAQWRTQSDYMGSIPISIEKQCPFTWTDSARKKVFVYIKQSYPSIETFLKALATLSVESRIFIPHAPRHLVELCSSLNLRLSAIPYDLSSLDEADLVICHGGHATTLQAILKGVPVLIIPLQQEQLCTARKCIDGGFGLGLGPSVADSEEIAQKIRDLLEELTFSEKASTCAAKYKNRFIKPTLVGISEYIESQL